MNSKLKKIKRIVVLFIVMSLIVSGCSKAKKEENNGIDSVELKSNQEIIVCKITAIDGNEIEYTVVKEQNTSDIKRDKMPSSSAAPDKGNGEKPSGERPSGAPDMGNGEKPSGERPSGAPDMGNGEKPSGERPSGAPDMNDRNGSSGDNSSQKNKSDKKVYTTTEEKGSITIPVGTKVITSLGKTTTFSRLSNGDIIKMILEKDTSGENVVVGVWIVS